eukprot:g6444.t1
MATRSAKWSFVAGKVKAGNMIDILGKHSKASKRGFGKGRKRTESSRFNSKWSCVRKEFQAVRKYKRKLRDLIFNAPALQGALTEDVC